jgi:hypothetical protein
VNGTYVILVMKTPLPGYSSRQQEEALQRRLSLEPEWPGEEAEIDHRHHKVVCWLGSLVAVLSLLFGILYLMEFATPRTAGPDHPGLAAEDVQSQGDVTLGRAFEMLSARH